MFTDSILRKPLLSGLHQILSAPAQTYTHNIFPGESVSFLVYMNLNSNDSVYVPTVTHTLGGTAEVESHLLYYYYYDEGKSPTGAVNLKWWPYRPEAPAFWAGDPLFPCKDIGTSGSPGVFRAVVEERMGEVRTEMTPNVSSNTTGAARYWVINVTLPTGFTPGNYTITVSFQGEQVIVPVHVGTHVVNYRFPISGAMHDAMAGDFSKAGYGITTDTQLVEFVDTLNADWGKHGIGNYYEKRHPYSINSIYEHALSLNSSSIPGNPRHYWSEGDAEVNIPQVSLDYYRSLIGKHSYISFSHMSYRFWGPRHIDTFEYPNASTAFGRVVPVDDCVYDQDRRIYYKVSIATATNDTITSALATGKIAVTFDGSASGYRYMQPGGANNTVDKWDMSDPNNPGFAWARALKAKLVLENLWDQFDGWVVHFDEPTVLSAGYVDNVYHAKPYLEQHMYTRRAMKILKVYYEAGFTTAMDCPRGSHAQVWYSPDLWNGSGLEASDGTEPIRMYIIGGDGAEKQSYVDHANFPAGIVSQYYWTAQRQAQLDAKAAKKEVGFYSVGIGPTMEIGPPGVAPLIYFLSGWMWGARFFLNYSIAKTNHSFVTSGAISLDHFKDHFHSEVGGVGGWSTIYSPYKPGQTGPAITNTFINSLRMHEWQHSFQMIRRIDKWDEIAGGTVVPDFIKTTTLLDAQVHDYFTKPDWVDENTRTPFDASDATNFLAVIDRTYQELDGVVTPPDTDPPDTTGLPLLSASSNLVGQVAVSWTAVPTATSYEIYHKVVGDIDWQRTEVSTIGHTFTLGAENYVFRVDAKNAYGETSMYTGDGHPDPGDPDAKKDIFGESLSVPPVIVSPPDTDGYEVNKPTDDLTDRVTVTWDAVPGATQYKVWWLKASETSGYSSYELMAPTTSLDVTGLEPDIDYKFRVDAGNLDASLVLRYAQMLPLDQIGRIISIVTPDVTYHAFPAHAPSTKIAMVKIGIEFRPIDIGARYFAGFTKT